MTVCARVMAHTHARTHTHCWVFFFLIVCVFFFFFQYKYPHAGLLHKDVTPFHSGGVSFCQLHHYTALKMELVGLTPAYSRPLALPLAKICASFSVFLGLFFLSPFAVMLCTHRVSQSRTPHCLGAVPAHLCVAMWPA